MTGSHKVPSDGRRVGRVHAASATRHSTLIPPWRPVFWLSLFVLAAHLIVAGVQHDLGT